ncbi:acyltransferase family protein [Microbacterium sp. NPDC057659]|uniref:acyltransferase family protein n=1 Tax=Microbacterium sp. NPDC057659 TaxID=3346198 RepID=UPI0036721193
MRERTPDRSGAIDLVRIIAVGAIVAGHVWTREVTADWLYTWHVPVFFVLSGYLWRPERSPRTELVRRTRSLAYPYVTWLVILTVVLLLVQGPGPDTRQQIAGGLAGGGIAGMPYITLWFVGALFFSTLLFRMLQSLPPAVTWVVGVLGAAAGWLWGPALADTPLGTGFAVTCLVYLLVGDGLRRLRDRIPAAPLIGLLLVGSSAVLIVTGLSAPLDIKQGDYGTPVLSLLVSSGISVGLILLVESVVRPGGFSRLCTFLALPLLVVVLAHPVFLWLPWPPWPTFAAAVLVPLVVGLVAIRTPAAQWITGQRRMPRHPSASVAE